MSIRCGKKLTTTFLTTLFAVALPCVTQAVPSISSAYGIFNEGGTVTLEGTGFGGKGPNIVLFDNFEKGTTGASIKTGEGSATIGRWTELAAAKPYYTNSTKVSGNLAFQADQSKSWMTGAYLTLPTPITDGQEIFATWWLYLPPNNNLPGEGNSAGVNWKQVWINRTTELDDLVVPTMLGSNSWFINGNNSPYSSWLSTSFTKGRWTRFMIWIKVGYSGDGNVHFWDLTDTGPVQRVNQNNVSVLYNNGYFTRYVLNAYGRATSNCYPTFDDVYVATGTNTRARVEIGNQPTYNNSSKLAISTVTSWSDDKITFTFRKGSFADGQKAYLFVFDGNGQPSAGFPFVVGGEGGEAGTSPFLTAPQNLRVIE